MHTGTLLAVSSIVFFASATPALAANGIPTFDHVVIVMEENHAYNEIIGNTSQAPYINSLANGGALMTHAFAIASPSLPNYLALLTGSLNGVSGDVCPVGPFSPSLPGQLIAAGVTWASYAEGLSSVGSTACYTGNYDHDHAPFSSFSDVPASTQFPFQGYFPSDFTQLPRMAYVAPDLTHIMHDTNGTINQADTWLQQNLGAYATWAKTHNSLLVVVWDEDDGSQNEQVPYIFYGANVKTGQYPETVNHYNLLRTFEDMFNATPIGNSTSVSAITDIWSASTGGGRQ
jgi:phospholipase C